MISYLSGSVLCKADDGELVLLVMGVGYSLRPTQGLLNLSQVGEDLGVHIETCVSENDIALYAFSSLHEKQVFKALRATVKSVGPKLAQTLLARGPDVLLRAVCDGDVKGLSTLKGVGEATARRVVTELGPKLKKLGLEAPQGPGGDRGKETLSLLAFLGVNEEQYNAAVSKDPSIKELEPSQAVRRCLRHIEEQKEATTQPSASWRG